MDTRLTPFLQIQLSWAQHHYWHTGGHLQQQIAHTALWLVLDGELEVTLDGQPWLIRAGEAFLMPPVISRVIHALQSVEWLSLGLRATLFGRIDMSHVLQAPRQWQPAVDERALLEIAMRRIVASEDEDNVLIREGLTRAVWGLCWQNVGSSAAIEPMPDWLQNALQQMQEQPGMGIAELARQAGWSAAQFRRHFHHWVGMSPRDYSQQQRLQTAQRWLENTDWSIIDIAERLGFQDASQFGRVFKSATNLTPQTYRHLSKQREISNYTDV
jgi:AraC-like DNA-binding protein